MESQDKYKKTWWEHLLTLTLFILVPFGLFLSALGIIIGAIFNAPFFFIEKVVQPRFPKLANFLMGVLAFIVLILTILHLFSSPRCPEGTRWVPLPVADCV